MWIYVGSHRSSNSALATYLTAPIPSSMPSLGFQIVSVMYSMGMDMVRGICLGMGMGMGGFEVRDMV